MTVSYVEATEECQSVCSALPDRSRQNQVVIKFKVQRLSRKITIRNNGSVEDCSS